MGTPSKQVSIIFLITVIVVTIIIVWSGQKSGKIDNKPKIETQLSLQVNNSENLKIDTDSDGLMDWEEILWGTDPKNPDTDGDGTLDGEEVRLGRNPLVAGPDDENYKIDEQFVRNLTSSSVNNDSLTKKILFETFDRYFDLKQKGNVDPAVMQLMINDIVSKTISETKPDFKYFLHDVKTFNSDLEKNKLLSYANQMLTIQEILKNKLDLSSIPGSNSEKDIPKYLQETSENMIKIEIPEKITVDHIYVANNFYMMGQVLDQIINEKKDDPILTIISTQLANELMEQTNQRLLNIYRFFSINGIIYDVTKNVLLYK